MFLISSKISNYENLEKQAFLYRMRDKNDVRGDEGVNGQALLANRFRHCVPNGRNER
jgi:hypothetical protein